jgi:hypothetical protein
VVWNRFVEETSISSDEALKGEAQARLQQWQWK